MFERRGHWPTPAAGSKAGKQPQPKAGLPRVAAKDRNHPLPAGRTEQRPAWDAGVSRLADARTSTTGEDWRSTTGDGGERALHRRRRVDGAHAGAVEPGSQARRFVVEGGAAGGVDLLEQVDVHHAVGVLDPAAHDPAVPPGGAAG